MPPDLTDRRAATRFAPPPPLAPPTAPAAQPPAEREAPTAVAAKGAGHDRLPSLDGLRAVSIGLVILSHLPGKDSFVPWLWHLGAGNLGVRVFFVISGFLITTLLLAEYEKSGRISLKHFYFRRTFRIMPAAYVFLLAMWLASRLGLHELSLASVLRAATYTSNYLTGEWPVGHTWSLSVEEQFYLLWPGLLVLVGLRGGFRGAMLMLLISPLCRTAATLLGYWPGPPRYTLECVADALAIGCLLARHRDAFWQWRPYRALMESPAALLLPVAVVASSVFTVHAPPAVAGAVGYSLLNLAIVLTIDWCLRVPTSLVGRVLNLAPVAFVGTLSYSLYLWQQPFLNEKVTLSLPLRLAGLCVFALASYYAVERPFLTLRSRIERRVFRRPAKAAGVPVPAR